MRNLGGITLAAAMALNLLSVSPVAADDDSAHAYSIYLSSHAAAPIDYVMGKFKTHQVVALGELHECNDSLQFLMSVLNDERFIKDVGALAWEFGNENNQSLVDEFLQSRDADDSRLREAYRNHTHPIGWPFAGYLDVYRAVWKINHSGKGKIRIINADVRIDWSVILSSGDYERAVSLRDEHMASVVADAIKGGKKILFYAGSGHTRKVFSGGVRTDAVTYLARDYPERVFSIKLHGDNDANDSGEIVRICDGRFDYAFKMNGDKPAGFDLKGSPFGLADSACMRDMIRKGYKLEDLYDGYLFLGPIEKYKHTSILAGFYSADYLRTVERRYRIVFGRDISEDYGLKSLADLPAMLGQSWEHRKYQPIDAWKERH
jgi:hypothetical protein